MGFTLKHRELDSRGSFIAWGIGLEYEYDAGSGVLDIAQARRNKPLLYIECDDRLTSNPLSFTCALEKATQINALVFSNNASTDLSDILGERHLKVMLETSAMQASYCYDLEHEDFELFETRFCENHHLRKLRLDKCTNLRGENAFFKGELQTRAQNSIETCGAKLFSVVKKLSNKTIDDLLANQYSYPANKEAQNLLAVSSNLSLISKILDKNFHPMHKMKQIRCRNDGQIS